MLSPTCIDPSMLAYEAVYGPYNWNRFPLALPGCKAVVFKAPDMHGTWASRGIDPWYTGPSLDHYQCNPNFVPKTRAYRISGSTELFPQHCQVPFLTWNEHLQEVSDEPITTLQEMPAGKQSGVLLEINLKLALTNPTSKRTLTCPMHKWMLPPGDLQRVPAIPPMEQRVEQRVDNATPPNAIWQVTDAPPIMATPNLTTKQVLKLNKRTHSRTTQNNTLGSVPAITNIQTNQRPFLIPSPAPLPTPTRQSLRHQTPITPINIPHLHFQNIPGGIRHAPMISQEAIIFFTKCVWSKSQDIFMPSKLQ
jgi:hypothetical protein